MATRKDRQFQISLKPGQEFKLQGIAKQWGITWRDRPSVSGLMQAIADGKLVVSKGDDA